MPHGLSVAANWPLWFMRLEGWPVFLPCVAVVVIGMLMLSGVMSRLSQIPPIQNMLIAAGFMGVVTALVFALVILMSRW